MTLLDARKRKHRNHRTSHDRVTPDGWTYYRLTRDQQAELYSGFMRCQDGKPDQYLMAADVFWHAGPEKYAHRTKLHTPPSNLARVQTEV